jgi:hypothetical protein
MSAPSGNFGQLLHVSAYPTANFEAHTRGKLWVLDLLLRQADSALEGTGFRNLGPSRGLWLI